jgi:hypothetical protein
MKQTAKCSIFHKLSITELDRLNSTDMAIHWKALEEHFLMNTAPEYVKMSFAYLETLLKDVGSFTANKNKLREA